MQMDVMLKILPHVPMEPVSRKSSKDGLKQLLFDSSASTNHFSCCMLQTGARACLFSSAKIGLLQKIVKQMESALGSLTKGESSERFIRQSTTVCFAEKHLQLLQHLRESTDCNWYSFFAKTHIDYD